MNDKVSFPKSREKGLNGLVVHDMFLFLSFVEKPMYLEKLDRQQWTLVEAKQHIAGLIKEELERQQEVPSQRPAWAKQDPVEKSEQDARNELMTALRDGDLHATGRLSTRRRERYAAGHSGWEFHSGYSQPISPAHWREGHMGQRSTSLEFSEGEFIDIRLPRVMVLAIWPESKIDRLRHVAEADRAYTTPYLDLMQAAIREFGITARHQDKKDSIVAWFLEHNVEDEPLSRNLADSMATLIRLPSAQRGGAKRMIGPDLRDVG